jgi:hypothetical protein
MLHSDILSKTKNTPKPSNRNVHSYFWTSTTPLPRPYPKEIIKIKGPSMVAEIGRITVRGQPRQKASEIPSQSISWAWWLVLVIPAMWSKSPV